MLKQMRLPSWLSLTNLVWVLLCLLPMLHVWTVPNLSTKVVLAVFYIGTLIGILVVLRFWNDQELKLNK